MERVSFKANTPDELKAVAEGILNWKPEIRIYALQGKMGAGKTTLIKALGDVLEVDSIVSSPTFSLVNEYTSADGKAVYHFDFYRINKIEEVYDIGYEEYFYSDSYCFIEWPEMITNLMPESYVLVEIVVDEDEARTFNCSLLKA